MKRKRSSRFLLDTKESVTPEKKTIEVPEKDIKSCKVQDRVAGKGAFLVANRFYQKLREKMRLLAPWNSLSDGVKDLELTSAGF